MKKMILGLAFSLAMLITLPNISSAQLVVAIKPRPVVKVAVVKPKPPSPNYVWIGGHWKYDNRRCKYVWVDGHYVKRKKGKTYRPGHWKRVPGGYKWIPGRWV